jgi:hypothetical protein
MSTPPPVTKEATNEVSADPPVESVDGLSGEVKIVLELLAQLHDQTLALVEALGEMNERTYQPALEFLRDMQNRVGGGPAKE